MNDDFLDMLRALIRTRARFLVVGAHAMAVHGVPRATGDLDVWVSSDPSNADLVRQAIVDFGAPVDALGISSEDLEKQGTVLQIGQPPRRIDILTTVTGLDFDDAWRNRIIHRVGKEDVPFLSRRDLVCNKKATGRPKDLADLDALERERT